jgi:hypothetical protein
MDAFLKSMNMKGSFLNSVRENLKPADKKDIDKQMEVLTEKAKILNSDQLTSYTYINNH